MRTIRVLGWSHEVTERIEIVSMPHEWIETLFDLARKIQPPTEADINSHRGMEKAFELISAIVDGYNSDTVHFIHTIRLKDEQD